MNCIDFLYGYSDFRDGLLDSREHDRALAHLRECASCARYDVTVREGSQLARACAECPPSSDFLERLTARIEEEDTALRHRAMHRRGIPASLALTVAVGLAIGGGVAGTGAPGGAPALPPSMARAPEAASPERRPLSEPVLTHGILHHAGWREADEHVLFAPYVTAGHPIARLASME